MEKLLRSEKGLDSIECMLVVLIIGILGSLAVTLLGSMLQTDRKSTRLNSSHIQKSRMPSSA